jgi:molybdate transport system substrate-binding protein
VVVRLTPLLVVAATLASCGADGSEADRDVTVFAAASLTDAFTDIGEAFAASNPGVDVRFNVAGSSDLVAQIAEGAPADVFASADVTNMDRLVEEGGVVDAPVVFATNAAEIIVESGNPLGIAGPADLAGDDLVVVQCAPEVPCGSYAQRIIDVAGVAVTPASFEDNVKAVVTKVTLGEADAGIVYRTDVIAAGSAATGVAIPDEFNVVAEYPIAIPAGAPNPDAARAFIEFVLGPQGQEILTDYGFGAP